MKRIAGLLLAPLLIILIVSLVLRNEDAAGPSWSIEPVPGNGEALAALSCYTELNCVGVSLYSTQVIASDDGGATWKVFNPLGLAGLGFTSVDCVRDGTCFATGQLGTLTAAGAAVYKSTDGGKKWSVSHSAATPKNPNYVLNDVSCASRIHCVVTGTTGITGVVLVTEDGGRNWTLAKVPDQPPLSSFQQVNCLNGGTCYTVQGSEAYVYKSNDEGLTWSILAQPPSFKSYEEENTNSGLNAISCGSKSFCVVGGFNAHLDLQGTTYPIDWTTHDGGRTWRFYGPFASTGERNPQAISQGAISCTSPDDCKLGLSYGSIYQTTDGGASWVLDAAAPKSNSNLLALDCVSQYHCVASAISNLPSPSYLRGEIWVLH